MKNDDPFGFDISVSSAKKSKPRSRRGMSGEFEMSKRICDHKDCNEAGKYRAPKCPDILDEYYWFCKTHVREYNLKWNFFEGTPEQDLKRQIDADKLSQHNKRRNAEQRAWSRLGVNDPHELLGANATQNPGKSITGTRVLPPLERRAVEILECKSHYTKSEIRKSYKALIKVLHPDMNGGDRSDEEKLQEVVWAWDQIKDSQNFE